MPSLRRLRLHLRLSVSSVKVLYSQIQEYVNITVNNNFAKLNLPKFNPLTYLTHICRL